MPIFSTVDVLTSRPSLVHILDFPPEPFRITLNPLYFEFQTAESTPYVCEYQYGNSTTSRLTSQHGYFPGYGSHPFLEPCKLSKE